MFMITRVDSVREWVGKGGKQGVNNLERRSEL